MTKRKKNQPALIDEILKSIREGDEKPIKELYHQFRDEFINWALKHYQIEEMKAANTFQDAIIIFHRNVVQGKITTLNSSIKTYLFGIGKKLLLKHLSTKSRVDLVDQFDDQLIPALDLQIYYKIEKDHRQLLISQALKNLKEKCRKTITLFFFNRFSHEAIANRLGYNNANVSRTMMRKCLNKLSNYLDQDMLND